jgi:hypothetical protein
MVNHHDDAMVPSTTSSALQKQSMKTKIGRQQCTCWRCTDPPKNARECCLTGVLGVPSLSPALKLTVGDICAYHRASRRVCTYRARVSTRYDPLCESLGPGISICMYALASHVQVHACTPPNSARSTFPSLYWVSGVVGFPWLTTERALG